MTKVKFYNEAEGVFAVFPNEYWNGFNNGTVTCYAHIGQHSACHTDYLKQCTIARKEEYEPLRRELESIGHKFHILNK